MEPTPEDPSRRLLPADDESDTSDDSGDSSEDDAFLNTRDLIGISVIILYPDKERSQVDTIACRRCSSTYGYLLRNGNPTLVRQTGRECSTCQAVALGRPPAIQHCRILIAINEYEASITSLKVPDDLTDKVRDQLIEHSVDCFVDEYMPSIDPVSGFIGHVIDALVVSIGLPPVVGTFMGQLAKLFVEEALSPGALAVHAVNAVGQLDIDAPNDPELSVSSPFVELQDLVGSTEYGLENLSSGLDPEPPANLVTRSPEAPEGSIIEPSPEAPESTEHLLDDLNDKRKDEPGSDSPTSWG